MNTNRHCCSAILLAAAAGLLFLVPGAAATLQYDRFAIATGQWWRILTGHWVHFSFDHLLWDGLVFAFLGFLCERSSPRRFWSCLLLSSVLISGAVWVLHPQMILYRGLSGLDSALFALLLVEMLKDRLSQRDWPWVGALAGFGLAFAAKTLYEMVTGAAIFVDSEAANFIAVPVAHVVGAAVGAAAGAWPQERKSREMIRTADPGPTNTVQLADANLPGENVQ